MKKLLLVMAIVVLSWGVAGAGEMRIQDSPKTIQHPENLWILVESDPTIDDIEPKQDCNDWEYMSIKDGDKVPAGWEPFGIGKREMVEWEYESLSPNGMSGTILRKKKEVLSIWLKRRICE